MKILVVGGGTAGFVSALILKKRFGINAKVDLVKSNNIGTIGVGEGSTEHWYEFMKFVNIPFTQLILKTEATFKTGIFFKNWSNKHYLHNVNHLYDRTYGQHRIYFEKLIIDDLPLSSYNCIKSLIDTNYLNREGMSINDNLPANQFHFNSLKLIEFLQESFEMVGGNVFTDDIKDVILNNKGEIDKVKSNDREYEYDFYIDCTGFKRLLISKLGVKWNSYKDYLKMNCAMVFPTKNKEDIDMFTTAEAMNSGWRFEIPIQSRRGNGYIFDKNYITPDKAKEEIENHFGHEIEVNKVIDFDPGTLDKFWIKNCVAMGLSGSFVEPLEATSIGTTIQQSFILMHYLKNYNETVIKKYNDSMNDIMTNIRDFIQLHYITNRNDTDFWRSLKDVKISDTLKEKLKLWKHRLPISEDFNKQSDYILFKDVNWIHILYGMNLIDVEKIKENHNFNSSQIIENVKDDIKNTRQNEKNVNTITHKQYLDIFKEIAT